MSSEVFSWRFLFVVSYMLSEDVSFCYLLSTRSTLTLFVGVVCLLLFNYLVKYIVGCQLFYQNALCC